MDRTEQNREPARVRKKALSNAGSANDRIDAKLGGRATTLEETITRIREQASKNILGKKAKSGDIVVVAVTREKADNKSDKRSGRVARIKNKDNISQKTIDQITQARVSQLLDGFDLPKHQLSSLHSKVVELVRSSVSEALERHTSFNEALQPANVVSLPTQPPETYQGLRGPETPPEFVKRVYGPWLGQGLTRADIRKLDPKLAVAITNWLSRPGNAWPEDVDLPTKAEQNERLLSAGPEAIREHLGKFTGQEALREAARINAAAHYRK